MASHTRAFSTVNMTSGTGTATNAAFTTSQYMAIFGGSATQRIDWNEILISGFASSSAAAGLMVSHASVLHATPTALATATGSDGPLDSSAAALAAPPTSFIAATTQPTSTNNTTDPRLNLGLNLNGGIIRWVAAPNMNWTQLGNTATLGECVLAVLGTGFTSGTFSAHILYEPY